MSGNRKRERKRRFALGAGLAGLAMITLAAAFRLDYLLLVLPATLLSYGAHRAMIGERGVPVLTYHSVTNNQAWLPWAREITVRTESFAAQVAMLQRLGLRTITTQDMLAYREKGALPPPNCIVLHFDDGYLDNLTIAAPILQKANMTATVFPSLDFIEPERARARADGDAGYLTWSEIRNLRDRFGWGIEPHGVNHGRIPVSAEAVDTLTADNWRRHAWLQWHHMPGAKHDWFRQSEPPAVPIGSPVPQSALALAACGVVDGRVETARDLDTRIIAHLSQCRNVFAKELGNKPDVFCWPENQACARGREVAEELGYSATTAGKGRNTLAEDARIISRIHVGDRALGFRWPWADAVLLRAQIRLMQGNFYWYAVVAPMNAMRALVFAVRDRTGRPA